MLLADEEPGLQVLGDGAYGSGETLSALGEAKHKRAIKPWPTTPAVPGGFERDDFVVDEEAGTVTCPAGHTVSITAGRACRVRSSLSRMPAPGTLHQIQGRSDAPLHPHDDELMESRRAWREGDFAEDYRRWRPMVERSIAWLVADNHRRVRFRGVEKNQLGLSLRIAAINLRRLVNLGLTHNGGWQAHNVLSSGAQARVVKKGPPFGLCPSRVADFNPLRAGASVGHTRTCDTNIRPDQALFNSLLGSTRPARQHAGPLEEGFNGRNRSKPLSRIALRPSALQEWTQPPKLPGQSSPTRPPARSLGSAAVFFQDP